VRQTRNSHEIKQQRKNDSSSGSSALIKECKMGGSSSREKIAWWNTCLAEIDGGNAFDFVARVDSAQEMRAEEECTSKKKLRALPVFLDEGANFGGRANLPA
jgi:hypothetical protein